MKILKPLAIAAVSIATLMPAKAGIIDDYEKATKASLQTAMRDVILTPKRVVPDEYGVEVTFQVENKSSQEYVQIIWDCAALRNSEPIVQQVLIVERVLASGRVRANTSYPAPRLIQRPHTSTRPRLPSNAG